MRAEERKVCHYTHTLTHTHTHTNPKEAETVPHRAAKEQLLLTHSLPHACTPWSTLTHYAITTATTHKLHVHINSDVTAGYLIVQQRKKETSFKTMLKAANPPLLSSDPWEEVSVISSGGWERDILPPSLPTYLPPSVTHSLTPCCPS